MTTGDQKTSIAIVGLGISGLGCAHILQNDANLTLFEANDYIGGHSNTVTVDEAESTVAMDTGFMVYNEDTYPHLKALFATLGVKTKETSMSFSVNHVPDRMEFNGGAFNQVFGQRKNLFRPRFWKLVQRICKFSEDALVDLENAALSRMTLREYVEYRGYGEDFLNWYLVPMASAVWSSPPEKIEEFPAMTLLRFWRNHGFLAVKGRKQWRTVEGGSRQYVEKLTHPLKDLILTNSPVRKIRRENQQVIVETDKDTKTFDHVIIAAHGDDAYKLLQDPTELEKDVLPSFQYQPNRAVVHTDASVMPKNRRCWASWNYRILPKEGGGITTSTHYWMNSLQGVSKNKDYFVSINPEIAPKNVLREIDYRHPLFDLPAIAAQDRIDDLHTAGKTDTQTFYVGAWQRYGFHEDGLLSAVRLCETLLGKEIVL